ncbi:unnamed protein product, partial [Ceratitis capitata]
MDVDSSRRYREPTQQQSNNTFTRKPLMQPQNQEYGQEAKRLHSGTARFIGPKQKSINHLTSHHEEDTTYQEMAASKSSNIFDDLTEQDQINSLAK